ncbi:hypothetical protein D3C71_182540 [compost metagenome]
MLTKITLRTAISALFPDGYQDYKGYRALFDWAQAPIDHKPRRPARSGRSKTFKNPPCQAVDLFAIAGFLLQKSGGYHHVSPEVAMAATTRMIAVTATERKSWIEAGRIWRGDGGQGLPKPPKALTEAWNELMRYSHVSLYLEKSQIAPPRPWWKAALALLVIADEAAKDLGFETGRAKSAQAKAAEAPMRQLIGKGGKIYTLSSAQKDQVCVLPKSRTPKVGCTLRSLSHNLALLPSRGLARAYWSPHPEVEEDAAPHKESAPFNLVVIPAPFSVRAGAFSGVRADEGSWGWFHIKPHWCPASTDEDVIAEGFDAFWAFVHSILERAQKDVGAVHGLIFPEASLSNEVFRRLCQRLQEREHFELIVAGLFDAPDGEGGVRAGNFAGMARRQRSPDGTIRFDFSTREKHHRWRVEKNQIETYALGASLDAGLGWWEQIDILSRSLDIFVLRGGATVTTLICEDLARNDPCQELVRGIGPNLVFALLMDGPQLRDRWPARYATVLAEDPGSSVLTVTSMGLIERANATGQYPLSDKMALWRDDTGKTVELSLPRGSHGLCLTLQPTKLRERTLDGRHDEGSAQSWRLTGIVPVTGDPDEEILAGKWPTRPT